MIADNKTIQKIERMLSTIYEADKFGASDRELDVDDLDKVLGGVAVPDFGQFLKYVQDRDANSGKK